MNTLYRLVYTSKRKSSCGDKEISNILKACQKNTERKITGILLHSKNRFIQYLEGHRVELDALFNLIKEDSRHTDVVLRNFEPVPERVFPSWEMGYRDIDQLSFNTNASKEDKEIFDRLVQNKLGIEDNAIEVLKMFFELS